MKKKTSIRILSFLMTAILVSMCFVTAMATAADNYGNGSVAFEIPAHLTGHSFAAYQIFSCKVENGSMTNVEWGSGINSADFLKHLVDADTDGDYNTTMDAAQCAAVMQAAYASKNAAGQEAARALILAAAEAAKATPITFSGATTLPRGYYLIEDTTAVEGKDMAANHAVLTYTNTGSDGTAATTGSFKVKTDKPTVEKKVREDDKDVALINGTNPYGTGFNDVADANIGQAVDFLLVGAVPDMTYYDTYTTYTFEDTLSKGLTVSSDIEVWLSDNKSKSDGDTNVTRFFNITQSTDATTGKTKITISLKKDATYKGDLKQIDDIEEAEYVLVTYQAKLNEDAVIGLNGNPNEVILKYSNNPNGTGEGQTVKDKVIVFTYEVDTTKVDSTNTSTKLDNAKFHLYRMNNSAKSYAVLDQNAETGAYYVSSWSSDVNEATDIVTAAGGLAKIVGLDDGTYFLDEFEAPAGYIAVTNPITVTVAATTDNRQDWDGTNASDVLTSLTNGKVALTVENSPIGILPETGGMGTTLFTLGGLVLMMAAAMLFVLRRREEV